MYSPESLCINVRHNLSEEINFITNIISVSLNLTGHLGLPPPIPFGLGGAAFKVAPGVQYNWQWRKGGSTLWSDCFSPERRVWSVQGDRQGRFKAIAKKDGKLSLVVIQP